MGDTQRCTGCGLPLMLSEARNWEGNGVMSLTQYPGRRVVLFGSGNIDYLFKEDGDRIASTIRNSRMHLSVVGIVQALMEPANGQDTSMPEWELAGDGDLSITVHKPRPTV